MTKAHNSGRRRTNGNRILVLLSGLGLLLARPATGRAAGPEPGTMIGPDTAPQAEGLIPTEFLERYRRGEWRHAVALPKPGTLLQDPDWVAAGKENEGKFTINEEGSIREVATGKQPAHIWGPPFPTIDPKDPKAGYKIIWNYFYSNYVIGDDDQLAGLVWIDHGGAGRQLKTRVIQKFYDGQKPFRTPKENPQNLLYQQYVNVTFPTDVEGSSTLAWRYRDTKRDSNWAYVPALRRVRQVSPANRSDGSFGSDISQDDGFYFDGKPEDFEWKVIGEDQQLFLFDKDAVVGGIEDIRPLPNGGWRSVYPNKPLLNYQKPDFSGKQMLAWGPVAESYVLVKRPVWVVEVTPKDRYYLYGKLILRFDKDNFYGCYSSKYDWQGNILNSYLVAHGAFFKKGDDYRFYVTGIMNLGQNFKLDRATAAISYAGDDTIPFDTLIPISANQFETTALVKGGR